MAKIHKHQNMIFAIAHLEARENKIEQKVSIISNNLA